MTTKLEKELNEHLVAYCDKCGELVSIGKNRLGWGDNMKNWIGDEDRCPFCNGALLWVVAGWMPKWMEKS